MSVFFTLLGKLIPLYLLIGIGQLTVKYLKADKKTVSSLLIYFLTPAVVFYGAYKLETLGTVLTIPVIFFVLCCCMCLIFYAIGKQFWTDPTKNILAMTAGTGNTGYFGLPVGLMLFGPEALSYMVIAAVGFTIYENTLGFYITAKGNHSGRDSLIKALKVPTFYAFLAGLALQAGSVELPTAVLDIFDKLTGAYSVLGMMIIGMGLSGIQKHSFDLRFLSLAFFAKFVCWPLLIWGLISLDQSMLHLFPESIYPILMLMGVVPLAANTVSQAVELHAHPEKAALAVLLSTLFALVYIPFATLFFL